MQSGFECYQLHTIFEKSMAYLVGIDLGSSSLKVAVFQEDGTVIAKQSAANALHTPRPGWSEYDPQEVWERIEFQVRVFQPWRQAKPHGSPDRFSDNTDRWKTSYSRKDPSCCLS